MESSTVTATIAGKPKSTSQATAVTITKVRGSFRDDSTVLSTLRILWRNGTDLRTKSTSVKLFRDNISERYVRCPTFERCCANSHVNLLSQYSWLPDVLRLQGSVCTYSDTHSIRFIPGCSVLFMTDCASYFGTCPDCHHICKYYSLHIVERHERHPHEFRGPTFGCSGASCGHAN